MSPVTQLQKLERNLRDAEERFAHTPGGLWLAAGATLEALDRLPKNPALSARVDALTTQAQRMQADGDARASRHELAALSEWVELARQRCTLELYFLDLLRTAPQPITSRAELANAVEREQRVLAMHAKDPLTLTPASEALVARLRTEYPEYDPTVLPLEMIAARGKQALREVQRAGGKEWTTQPFPTSLQSLLVGVVLSLGAVASFALLSASLWKPLLVSALAIAAFLFALLAASRRRSEVQLRVSVLEAWGFTKRRGQAGEEAKTKLDSWITIARALGQIDAFRASDPGQSLHARETRLPALAPWVRMLVGGMDEEQAQRFESEE